MSIPSMNYQLLGRSGLRVSDLSLGTMTFGEDWGWGSAKDEARKIYTNGSSEKLVGEFMKGHREEMVIATKYTNAAVGFTGQPGTDANAGGNQRKNMVQAVEASLKRLGTDYIDLYWLHIWDQITPAKEVMRALDDLVRAGKVLYVGISDAPAWVVAKSNVLAELRGWTRYVGLQIEYSLLERTVERTRPYGEGSANDRARLVAAEERPAHRQIPAGKREAIRSRRRPHAQRDDEGFRLRRREHACHRPGDRRGGPGVGRICGTGRAG